VTPVGPGRFTLGAGAPWWVLWDDADNRTLAIGTPSGAFGFVLNRGADIPSDRIVAAREILDFNSYDLSRLRRD
jgi:apolipoprotein D and lipocalin family protein